MINGFKKETCELTKEELKILELVCKSLAVKIGASKTVTNKKMVEGLANYGIKTSAPRIRKIINYIRVNGLVNNLIATSKGYYVAETKDEILNYIQSLEQRENSIRSVRLALQNQINLK